ncbi:MAG: GNAT family N-acetyltransferase [Thermoplasmata archaeon]|nr:GNAT family N-acetyltransferase [Thermoplasmata archaeon]MCI4359098.1 GNAT family N-acetyltransferase [Thermoplasmata archaeon]
MTVSGLPLLQGYALRLRAPARADLPKLFDWYNDPENVAPFDRFSLDTAESFEAAVLAAPDDPRSLAPRFVVERVQDGLVLGFVGHYQPHPVLETTDVWYVLGDRSQRGKGYGKEAVGLLVDYLFHEATLARVGATCDVENVASYRVLEGLRFRREGTLRSALFHHARWHDVLVYGVTRPEWAEAPRSLNPTLVPAP